MSDRNQEETMQWKAATWAMSVGQPDLVFGQFMTQLASQWPIDNIRQYGEALLCQDVPVYDLLAALSLAHNTVNHMNLQPMGQFLLSNDQVEALSELYGVNMFQPAEQEIHPKDRGQLPWAQVLKRLWANRIHIGSPSSHCICLKQGIDGVEHQIKVLYVDDIETSFIDVMFIEAPPIRLKSV